jgi:hypothetical protein
MAAPSTTGALSMAQRLAGYDWPSIEAHLDAHGWASCPGLLAAGDCRDLAGLYDRPETFRSEYKYFDYPLPPLVAAVRTASYERLVPIANRWSTALRLDTSFPLAHDAFLARCHEAGQRRPTPLLLQYGAGDFNALHQDLYGDHVFPLQLAVLLSRPGHDFTGGEFVLTEQRPRMQSRVHVVPLGQGDGVIFAVRHRPAQGVRGAFRVTMRHGVSRLHAGHRHTLGVIFHDAT